MLKKLLFTIAVTLTSMLVFSQSGTLKGVITDKDTKEAIPFANIVIESGGKQLGGTTTDFDGNYTIKPIPPGKYDVKATYVGYKNLMIQGVIINSDKIRFLDITMESTSITLATFETVAYQVPLIDKDETSTGGTMTAEEIEKMPGRSAESVAISIGGVFSADGEMGSIRGARTSGTVTYIDGVRVRGSSSLPKSALGQVSVITGGTPARYGDATGGIVNITTKGPSREFGAGMELITSQYLDRFGYNLMGLNVQGPLIKGKDTTQNTSLLGFFLAVEGGYFADNRPFAIPYYTVNEDYLRELEANPLRPTGTGFGAYQNSLYVRKENLTEVKHKSDAGSGSINLSGKIDVRSTETTNLTFGGQLNYGRGRLWSYANSWFNSKNNGEYISSTWRVYGKFTQRFPAAKDSKSLIKNVYYSIQADYSRSDYKQQNMDHGDNIFNYGYVGKFKTYKIKSYELGSDTALGYNNVWVHNGFFDTLYSFQPSEINPDLSAYTSNYYSLYPESSPLYNNYTIVQTGGALLNGNLPASRNGSVYGMFTNTGTPYGGYSVSNSTQIGINANGSADIGNHEIQFGLMYEQTSSRGYSYDAVGLWTLMRQLANKHIEQRDLANPHPVFDANGVFQDTIWYDRLYDESSQAFFDLNLRKKLGLAVNGLDWIDIDNLDPTTFTVDMFNADELLNNGNAYVSYYGYDHTGKPLKNKPSFDDFFTETDEFGNFTRAIGAFEPNYMAGYIQDKFAFKDLIFNIGLRVDRYDANQKVLKDPYLLFDAKTVNEVTDLGDHPSNMGSDYIVYVNDVFTPTSISGYRNGSVWYNSEGAEIADPSILEGASGIAPYLVDPNDNVVSSKAFKDYEPQISVMPRISFSFPISDEALFFAHYDVLTKRATEGEQLNPTSYYYLTSLGQSVISNPNLKPEQTIDYELGFQQKISNSSSLKFSAYYREMRDMVQAYRFSQAYPVSYISYNNIDFGTVKGMTISYDLRRTSNVWVKASYTMQFANGTGSSATSGINLVASGQPNLRTLNPYGFDQRHQIKTTVDFHFDEGKKYNGPKFSKRIREKSSNTPKFLGRGEKTDKVKIIAPLENTGFNVTFNGGSGTPYSRQRNITSGVLGGGASSLQGQINGSRLPWQFRIDARIDKDVYLKFGKGSDKDKKFAYLNIYLQILNVLNSENIMGVYRGTGNPDDDGYLAAAEFQNAIESQNDPTAFREMYEIRANSPYNYSLPRRIRLGVVLNF